MKSLYKLLFTSVLAVSTFSCMDLEEVNSNPNSPLDVPSNMLMNGTQKWIVDNIYDNWFSGRQCLLYSQYWAQRNYTEEDRYQIRESTNNSYFNYLYMGVGNLNKIIELNENPEYASLNSGYGFNENQIAAAKVLKVWLMSIISDTWGSVPYYDVSKLDEGVVYCKYDDHKDIYYDMINELTQAASMIDESEPAFTSGDIIYGGDASKWKKFANSLKCRMAIHISKIDPAWRTYISEAIESGVFTSNSDVASFKYSNAGSEYCKFYEGFWIDGRNDLTITKPFTDILKGQPDTLNSKSHPWEGVVDLRFQIFGSSQAGVGMPYGSPSGISSTIRVGTPSFYYYPPVSLNADFAVPLMTYAELQFILSEYNGFSEAEYKEGVRSSILYWASLAGESFSDGMIDEYIDAVSKNIDAESVAMQKYIDLYMNGTEAWVELRRTGYPEQLLRPEEYSSVYNGQSVKFYPLSEVKGDIISRVKYPTNESSLNGDNWREAVSKLQDGTNNYYTRMFWDARTSTYDHPANK